MKAEEKAQAYIVMGVAGCGKSLIGSMLAKALQGTFADADDFHPAANKAKMGAKIPLNDDDRWPWLSALRQSIVEKRGEGKPYVLACSALKKVYRDVLRGKAAPVTVGAGIGTEGNEENEGAGGEGDAADLVQFVYLQGSRELIAERLGARKGHFMPSTLLDSQFATLEEPRADEAMTVSIDQGPEEMVQEILERLGK